MSALAQTLLPCPYGHTINFEKSGAFRNKKYGRPHLMNSLSPLVHKMSEIDNLPSPLTADVLYGQPLISIPYYHVLPYTAFQSCESGRIRAKV